MSIQIIIDNPGIFGPGDVIKGKVVCTFHSQEHIRGIKCRFRCQEETQWNQRRGKHNVHYKGKNTVISANNNFIGEGDMTPGRYEYSFAYALPAADIPSSYTHKFGFILYHIEALVDRPFAFDYRKEVTLHVVVPVPLVREQNMLPLRHQVEESVCSLCCASGTISLDVILEKNMYLLGEAMNFKVHLVNNSDIEVEGLRVELSGNIEFTAHNPSTKYKVEKNLLAIAEKTGVCTQGEKTYNINLTIPEDTIIHSFSKCLLFKQWFALNVIAVLPTFHSNLTMETTVKVGHSILGISNQIESPTVQTVPTNNFVPVGKAPPDCFLGETEQPPPSYNDVINQR